MTNTHGAQLTLLHQQDEECHWQIHWPETACAFDGHFPGLPILPGVVQFDIAVRQCAHWYPLEQFRRIDKLKFQEPVVPGDTITLTLRHIGHGTVQFRYRLDEQLLSSGQIVFDTTPNA